MSLNKWDLLNKTIEQVDGVIEVGKEESNQGEKNPNDGEDDVIFGTINDLTISPETFDNAFCSIEENLCTRGNDVMIESVSEEAFKEEADPEVDGNTLFSKEIKVKSNTEFIEQIEKIFEAWRPTCMANPRGKLACFKKKKFELVRWFFSHF